MRIVKISGPPQSILESDLRRYLQDIANALNQSGDALANVSISTTETPGSTYTFNEQLMLAHLRIDVSAIATTVNTLLASLRTIKILDV